MRVLSVGSMYPPHSLGGYEQIWRSAVEHLRSSGHTVRALASDYRKPDAPGHEDADVHRELRWYWRDHRWPRLTPRQRLSLERHNAAVFDAHVRALRPEVVSWWAMGGMSLSLIERARRAGLPAAGVVCDFWLEYGPRVDAWTRLFAGRPRLGRLVDRRTGIPTRFDPGAAAHWLFMSDMLRRRAEESGLGLPRSEVAHRGIDADRFPPAPQGPWGWRLAYVGRIDRRKGIDTAVRALSELPAEATLTVVGDGDRDHLAQLRSLAHDLRLDGRVRFEGARGDDVAQAYVAADAVLFPVRWEEPWGLVPLEAMAVGRPVVATGTGGSGEYLRDEHNCLLYRPPDDHRALAGQVRRLAADERLRARLHQGGRETAGRFSERSFNEAVEAALRRAAGR